MSAGSWTETHSAGTPEGAMTEQMVCYLNLQTLTDLYRYFRLVAMGHLLLPQIYFCPSFLLLSCTFFFNVQFSFIFNFMDSICPSHI